MPPGEATVCLCPPGGSHAASTAGRSRVPHMAAAGGSWPRSRGRSCLVPAPLAALRHTSLRTQPSGTHVRSLVRAQRWLCHGRRPRAQRPNEAKERAFGLGQRKPGELRCGAEPSLVRKPRTCGSRCWPRTRRAPNSSVAVSRHPGPARCMEDARIAGFLWGETEARGSGCGRASWRESLRGSVSRALLPAAPRRGFLSSPSCRCLL